MSSVDKNYLKLQFKDKVHSKNAAAFQSFFEDIMDVAFSDFKKIRPYGNQGDGGNDGYVPSAGIYYQVYAPMNPAEKDADAAEKFRDNFNTLKEKWSEISKIKEYNFVFNDKYTGSSIELEKAKAELQKDNPEINFNIFLPKSLEEIFLNLTNEQLVSLGFDVDSRNALKMAAGYLENLEIELDRGNGEFVYKTLGNIKDIVSGQNDGDLNLEFEIIEARTLQKLERVEEAKSKYESIHRLYPQDPRASLYLAEIYLGNEDFEKNQELLSIAEHINNKHWLLQLEVLIRKYRLNESIDIATIDETTFPNNPRHKSDYYRIYSLFADRAEDFAKAGSFIEHALQLNPNKFNVYDIRLAFMERKALSEKDKEQIKIASDDLFEEIEKVKQQFTAWGGLNFRNYIFLNLRKFHLLFALEEYNELGRITEETFELVLKCYFDHSIDFTLVDLLRYAELSEDNLKKLLDYLQDTTKPISDTLSKIIVLQFIYKDTLFTKGKSFFEKIQNQKLIEFINLLENKKYDEILPYFLEDVQFAVGFNVAAKSFPELRKLIIENLPSDGSIQKEKLSLLLNYDEGDIDEAFSILKSLDLSKLSYAESKPILEIAEKKEAWDFVIILLNKLLEFEKDTKQILQIKLRLFTANFKIERFPEVIRIGEEILSNDDDIKPLDDNNREILLGQAVFAYLKRGEDSEAQKLIEKHFALLKSFDAKAFLVSEVYIKNNEPKKALESVVEAVKFLKRPSVEEYGSLFLMLSQIGTLLGSGPITTLPEIVSDSFVKFRNQERWVYVGTNDELDAQKIPEANHADFLTKKPGEKITSNNKYTSEQVEKEIELILPIEEYIHWQAVHNAHQLSLEGAWDKMEIIEVPTTEEGIDPKFLIARLEDEQKRGKEFFDLYCQQNAPLAFLALSEGGLGSAIGRITNEEKGFIKANAGTLQEMNEQKSIAARLIKGEEFYIDGTTALVFSETGLLEKIHQFLPGIKVPQSVISLLLELKEKFRYVPGQAGSMRYVKGKIGFSSLESDQRVLIEKNFQTSVRILESISKGIEIISAANKANVFSEQNIAPSLSDACILSQRDGTPILTEDFLYLQANASQTGKEIPDYTSSFAIMRVLYEQGKINFEEYLNFFYYLSSYRYHFLPIGVEDLEKAVLGDSAIKVVKPEELRKFNIKLTLSEEYGVPTPTAIKLMSIFLIKLIIDDSVLPAIVEKVFTEIITSFPTNKDKKMLSQTLLAVCAKVINQTRQTLIIGLKAQEKIDLLLKWTQTYNPNTIIVS